MANLFDVYNNGSLVDHTEGEKLETGETPITISGLTADTTYDKVQVAFAGSYNKSDVPSFNTNPGSNYLSNSSGSNLSGWTDKSSIWSVTSDDTRGNVFTATPSVTWTSGSTNSIFQVLDPNITGKQVTVSFWAKASVDGANFHSEPNGGINSFNTKLTISWTRYSYTISSFSGTIYLMAVDVGTTYYLNKIKLELGNVATDWIPSTEDTKA